MSNQQAAVFITVTRGPATGTTVELLPGRPVIVGRLAECGIVIPSDPTVSRHHCRIEVVGTDCRLTNKSSNGTHVNGARVEEAKLQDDDEIEIGTDSVLKVTVGPHSDAAAVETKVAPVPLTASPQKTVDTGPVYVTETCASGLTRFTGSGEKPSAAETAELLAGVTPLFAIVDFSRMGESIPDDLESCDYLFHWMPEEAAKTASPLIVAQAETPGFYEILENGWGRDAIVCLYSELEKPALVEHLRNMTLATGDSRPDSSGQAMLGFCWPSPMSALLANQASSPVEELLKGINAVLLEDAQSPLGWSIYARAEFSKSLEQAGFREALPEQSSEEAY